MYKRQVDALAQRRLGLGHGFGKLAVRRRVALRLRALQLVGPPLARRKVHLFGISVDFLRFGTVRRLVQLRFQIVGTMRVGYLRLDARARGNADGGDGIRAERTPRKQLARTEIGRASCRERVSSPV